MSKKSIRNMIVPLLALILFAALVLMERHGIESKQPQKSEKIETPDFTEQVELSKDVLILWDNTNTDSQELEEEIALILGQMSYGYDCVAVQDISDYTILDDYENYIISFQNWSILGSNQFEVFDRVRVGKKLLIACTPQPGLVSTSIHQKIGIENGGTEYGYVKGYSFSKDFMIGVGEDTFLFTEDDAPGIMTSLCAQLSNKCKVYMKSENGKIPILWEKAYGDGKVVTLNEVVVERYHRGIICAAFSLLEDVCIYPVINASAYYLDDFPSPVPMGDATFITRDYGLSVSSFYSTIWWPKVLKWEEEYGIKHTGLIIETYSDQVQGELEQNSSVTQYLSYGNMLLSHGGELGFHGYNHQPLCLEGIDDSMQFGEYNLWPTRENIANSLNLLMSFSNELFPDTLFQVYVPPSNILSEEGKKVLVSTCKDIRVIASLYLPSDEEEAYIQEFDVDEDGTINTPRIVSGTEIGNYQKLTAMCELNFHYVQSHFFHPDDALDEDRGAADGWEKMSECFEEYLDWVKGSVPNMRQTTGSEMGAAVLIYDNLSLQRTMTDNRIDVKIGGFYKEAYFLMRVNNGTPKTTENCELESICGDIYLVHALADEISIEIGE